MKLLKYSLAAAFSVFMALAVISAPIAEARVGGGRSSGFRGSRGYNSPSSNRYQGNQPQSPQYGQPAGAGFGNAAPGGGFMRGMMGGLAGGMIGSMLFGSLAGHAGGAAGTGGGIGMLEIILLLGAGYLALRYFAQRKLATQGATPGAPVREMPAFARSNPEPGSFRAMHARSGGNEHDLAGEIKKHDSGFDLTAFKEEQMDNFVGIQAAWNHRDLNSVSKLIAPELRSELDADIAQLKNDGLVNRIENIAVRGTELVEAWEENGRMFATLRFRANLLDYTVNENTGELVGGDKSNAIKFEEDWSFVRAPSSSDAWKLTAIQS